MRWKKFDLLAITFVAVNLIILLPDRALAFERYKNNNEDPGSNCSECHGDYTSSVSTKGTQFPSGDKHRMHKSSDAMGTKCDLCHIDGDDRNPFIGFSNGTSSNPGLGCIGCHGRDYGGSIGVTGAGLRAHHTINEITSCDMCHLSDPVPLPEEVPPPYFGTKDTSADDTCNSAPDYLENWSIGDLLGLDNDGDNEYDECDALDQDLDGIPDDCDIDQNPGGSDSDGNGILDDCQCAMVNIDGIDPVDFADFAVLAADWQQIGEGLQGDVNKDGAVDVWDLLLMATYWLADCRT